MANHFYIPRSSPKVEFSLHVPVSREIRRFNREFSFLEIHESHRNPDRRRRRRVSPSRVQMCACARVQESRKELAGSSGLGGSLSYLPEARSGGAQSRIHEFLVHRDSAPSLLVPRRVPLCPPASRPPRNIYDAKNPPQRRVLDAKEIN